MGTKEEIGQMLDSLNKFDTSQTDPPITEAPESPSTDPPAEEIVDVDTLTVPPKTEAPATEPPVEDELTTYKNKVEALQRRVDELSKPKATKPPSTKAPSTDPPISEEDFLKDTDLEDISRDPSAFNKLLNSIYSKAVRTARDEIRKGSETTLRSIPDIVKTNVAIQADLLKKSEAFYESNKDLKPFKKVVAAVFEEISAANPDKTFDEILPEVGKEARKRLELVHEATQHKSVDKDNPPPLPRKKGGRVQQPKPDTSSLQSEIEAMNKVVRP